MPKQTMEDTRGALLSRYREARAETDALFRIVRSEALYDRPIPERHRIIFYVGHLEAFDWNLLGRECGLASFHPEFDRLFAFGIDPIEGNLPADGPEDWPALDAITDYVERVRQELDGAFREDASGYLLNIAIEHRLMHAETLAYMFHQLPFDRKQRREWAATGSPNPGAPAEVHVPAGCATLGQRRDSGAFGWDNEFEAHMVPVPEFTIDKYKVTNGQYLEFVASGGYGDRSLWKDADWEWRSAHQISHPAFWIPRVDGGWDYRDMFESAPLPMDWPVYVSHAEASAYARWVGKALPTEAEWHRASEGGFGVERLTGSGWEWTSTKFAPFPGFAPSPHYEGYSAPFFDGKHYVLKGGSVRTAACMLRPSFRNWFQPWYQYVYAGFRCVSRRHDS